MIQPELQDHSHSPPKFKNSHFTPEYKISLTESFLLEYPLKKKHAEKS